MCFGSVLKSYLKLSDYDVKFCMNGTEGMEAFRRENFDLCVIDVSEPEMDGFALGREIRHMNSMIPFIFISSRGLKEDIREGYAIGADDFVMKPFDSELLVLRIKAILKRCEMEYETGKHKVYKLATCVYDVDLRTLVWPNGTRIKMTPKESNLLRLLCKHKDNLLTREEALNGIWGSNDYFAARSMDVYITKLRKYFANDDHINIENIHGTGFRIVVTKEVQPKS